jgi:hypothetical protein
MTPIASAAAQAPARYRLLADAFEGPWRRFETVPYSFVASPSCWRVPTGKVQALVATRIRRQSVPTELMLKTQKARTG